MSNEHVNRVHAEILATWIVPAKVKTPNAPKPKNSSPDRVKASEVSKKKTTEEVN
jgi:hypothetical protein